MKRTPIIQAILMTLAGCYAIGYAYNLGYRDGKKTVKPVIVEFHQATPLKGLPDPRPHAYIDYDALAKIERMAQ